ncbi:MAG: Uma2 family endonuclease [Nostocaceae cyanobacterium]|nr:Uma2 family endonuclease [Nostocaceae cyanobacterium]
MVIISRQVSELEFDEFAGQLTQTIVLPNISWKTYNALITDIGDNCCVRLAYNRGILTIKMPSKLHEIINRLLARIVKTLTEELDMEVVDVGSTTFNRQDLEKGAEPDTAFYIQNAEKLEGLDPEIPAHLAPDLVIEVDITSPSTERIKIYQALGVPEVWQYTKQRGLVIYCLQSQGYVESDVSATFVQVTATVLNQFLQQRQTQSENRVIRAVRSWIQEQI